MVQKDKKMTKYIFFLVCLKEKQQELLFLCLYIIKTIIHQIIVKLLLTIVLDTRN